MNEIKTNKAPVFVLFFLLFWLGAGLFVNSTNQVKFNINHLGLSNLAEKKTFALDPAVLDYVHADVAMVNGKVLTNRHPGLSIVGAAVYTVLKPFTGGYGTSLIWTASWISFLTSTFFSALIALFTSIAAVRLGMRLRYGLILGAVTVLGTTLLPHATVIHHDVLLTLFVIINISWITGLIGTKKHAPIMGLLAGFGAASSGVGAVALPGLALAVIIYFRRDFLRVVIPYGVFSILGLLPLLLYNLHYGGSLLTSTYVIAGSSTNFPVFTLERILNNLRFYLMSAEGSFPVYSPVAAAGLIGLFLSSELRRRLLPAVACVFASAFSYLLVMPSVGWCEFGPRFLMPFIPLFTLGFASVSGLGEGRQKFYMTLLVILSVMGLLLNIPAVLTTAMHCLKGFSPAQEWSNVLAGRYSTFPLLIPVGSALAFFILINIFILIKGGRDNWSDLFSGRGVIVLPAITLIALIVSLLAFGSGSSRMDLLSIENEAKMYPNSFSAHYVLGKSYISRGMNDKALGEIKKASTINPEHAEAHFTLGYLYIEMPGFSREAVAEFRAVVEYSKDPSEVSDAHTNIGNILARSGLVSAAVREYRLALEVNPDNAAAAKNLSTLTNRAD